MKKILITIIAEDDKFETSSFMNDFISFKLSESARNYHIKDLYYEEKRIFELTEDERAILRNIPVQEKYITRDNSGQLWTGKNPHYRLEQFEHLFQFIKERRRI